VTSLSEKERFSMFSLILYITTIITDTCLLFGNTQHCFYDLMGGEITLSEFNIDVLVRSNIVASAF
jgi:hypothetical protein